MLRTRLLSVTLHVIDACDEIMQISTCAILVNILQVKNSLLLTLFRTRILKLQHKMFRTQQLVGLSIVISRQPGIHMQKVPKELIRESRFTNLNYCHKKIPTQIVFKL